MRISHLAVNRPVTTLMAFVAIVVLGIVSYKQLPMQLIPDIAVPTVGIYMLKPGASPEEMTNSLTKPVEGIIAELPRVKRIRAWTGTWGTWLEADFEYGTDIRFTTIDLQERITSFQAGLSDRRTVIEVYPFTTDDFKNFLMELSLEGPEEEDLLYELVKEKVEPQVKTITGIAKVEVGGLTTDAADVEIEPSRLAGFGLEFGSVFRRIQAAGSNDTFLGRLKVPGENHYVRLDEQVHNVAELRQVPVDGRGVVRVEDIAAVTEGAAIENWVYRSNGNYAVGIRVDREEGENMIAVARTLRGRVEEINKTLPPGITLLIETDIAEIVEKVILEVRNLALMGAALALLVPLVFFRSWRISVIIFLSVPICVIAVFNLFLWFGMSINIFSIIGLALGVGMLVDNSIVVVENCFRLYFRFHESARSAAGDGGDEVSRALLASTLTSVVPFVPFYFTDGDFKLFVKEPALALVFPLLISLGVALTLSAMLTARALASIVRHKGARGEAEWKKAAERLNPSRSRLREFYRLLLKSCLRHRGRVIAAITVLLCFVFLEACGLVREANTDREGNRDVFRVWLTMPPGTLTSEASRTVAYVEAKLKTHEDIKRFGAWFRGDRASFDIHLHERKDRPSGRGLNDIRATIVDFAGDIPGGELTIEPPDQPGREVLNAQGDRGQLALKGLDLEIVENYASRLIAALESLPDITRAQVKREDDQPEYHAMVDREKTKLFGLNTDMLGQYIGLTRSSGTISSLVLKDGDDRTDVTISITDTGHKSVEQVKEMPVYSPLGSTVALGELTKFRASRTPGRLERMDRQSSLSVEYFWLPGTDPGELARSVTSTISSLPNPAGIVAEFEGEQRQIEDRNKDFIFVLLAAALLIYIVMATVFESYWV
ncbi:efflux RND transporter permease subunit, partial [Candidatus Poribacteria bacterium]|nr:efflux RND transporter permease subunit [Candidatus Poribacteria bacterium]